MRNDLSVSERLYGMLLHLYPKQFRATYGQQMRLTFRDACRDASRRGGVGGLLVLWLPTLLDLFKSALEARARQGEITMSKARLSALAGPLTISVGTLWILSAIVAFASQVGLFNDEGLLALTIFPFLLSFIPLLFALLGTHLRFYSSANVVGKFGLTLSVVAGMSVLIFMLSTMLRLVTTDGGETFWVNYGVVGCMLLIRVGYFLFGIDALRYHLLPRWNLLPLLLGLTLLLSLPMEWFGVPAILPVQWANAFLHFALSGACWLLLGIAMTNPKREPYPVAI